MTLIIAHRGASVAESENTVAAFRRAVAMGSDGIELDVRRTRDDRLVVHHDPRLADGRVIRETSTADLPAHIPELDAALDACAGAFVNVEIKNDPDEPDFDPSDWIVHRLLARLERRGTALRWLVSSFRFETVQLVRTVSPGVRTGWLVTTMDAGAIRRCLDAGHHAVHPRADTVDESQLLHAHAVGLAVNTWTCDDPARLRQLLAWGVDGICTNVPDVALALRRGGA